MPGMHFTWAAMAAPAAAVMAFAVAFEGVMPDARKIELAVQFGCAPIIFVGGALCMPEPELPSSSARRTAIAVITFWTALNTLGAVRKWMVKPPGPERLLTAGLHAFCAALNIAVTCSAWWSGGRTVWRDFRLAGVTFFAVRLVGNELLRQCCAPAWYPPGRLDYITSCACCVWTMLVCVVSTPHVRMWLAARMGRRKVAIWVSGEPRRKVVAALPTPAPPSSPTTSWDRRSPVDDSLTAVQEVPAAPLVAEELSDAAPCDDKGEPDRSMDDVADVPFFGAIELPTFMRSMENDTHGYAARVRAMQREDEERVHRGSDSLLSGYVARAPANPTESAGAAAAAGDAHSFHAEEKAQLAETTVAAAPSSTGRAA